MKNNIQIQFVPIEKCEFNIGQITDVPGNPRTRDDKKQLSLQKSIAELPELTTARAALVYQWRGKYIVLGGNRRLEAQRALGVAEIPVIVLPKGTPAEKLRRIVMLDNEQTGQTDWNAIATDWDIAELKEWEVEIPAGWDKAPEDFGEQFNLPSGNKKPFQQMTFTLADAQASTIKQAIEDAKKLPEYGVMENFGNLNSNGNALTLIIKQWAEQRKSK